MQSRSCKQHSTVSVAVNVFVFCRYKLVELAFYLTMGFFPASVVTSMVKYRNFKFNPCFPVGKKKSPAL